MITLLESVSLRTVSVEDIPSGTAVSGDILQSSSVRTVSIEDIPSGSTPDDNTVAKAVDLSIAGYTHEGGSWEEPVDMTYTIVRKK